MKEISFEEWLVKFYTFSEITSNNKEYELYPLKQLVEMLMEYDDYLSISCKRFIYWYFRDRDYGNLPFSEVWGLFWLNKFFKQHKNSSSITMYNDYKSKIDGFISKHCETDEEKAICIKILLTSIWIDIEDFETGLGMKLDKDYCVKKQNKIEKFFYQIRIYYELKFRKYNNKNNRLKILDTVSIGDWGKLGWIIKINKDYKEEKSQTSISPILPQTITPIKLELNQTQIIYLFQQLVEKGYLKTNQNPKLWNLISQYFVGVDNKQIKNIHQLKDKLENSNTGKPRKEADNIEKIVKFLDDFKD